jgi:hypothetical protein
LPHDNELGQGEQRCKPIGRQNFGRAIKPGQCCLPTRQEW